jgi:hypothetical protein
MGFLEKWTRPSPEVQKVVDAEKAKMGTEADKITAGIEEYKKAEIAKLDEEYAARMAPIEQHIAATKDKMQQQIEQHTFENMFIGLRTMLPGYLATFGKQNANPGATMKEAKERVENLKENLTAETLTQLEAWSLEQVAGNDRGMQKIKRVFEDFRQELEKKGVQLG